MSITSPTRCTLFGPGFIPAGGSASPRTTFTPVSQTQMGDGSAATPWTITTVVTLGSTGLTLTERDVYVSGAENYVARRHRDPYGL